MGTLKSCLSGKTVDEIVVAQAKSIVLSDLSYLLWAPVVDGDFLLGKQMCCCLFLGE